MGDLSLLKESLLEILGFIFAKKLSNEVKKGLYQYYVLEKDDLHRIHGKINVKDQIIHAANKSTKVSCEFDEFTSDTRLNQVLKAAILILMRNTLYSETQSLLRNEAAYFDQVSSTAQITFQFVESIHFNRSNRRFYEVFLLAKLILTGMTSTSGVGYSKNFSILFKMNELYEEYIAFLVQQIVSDVRIKERKYKLLVNEHSGGKNFMLEPDLVIPSKKLIIDTKWKRYNPLGAGHGVQRDDLYQMYAYLTRYNSIESVVLLYPYADSSIHGSGNCLNSWHLEGIENKKILCYTINYQDEKEAVKELRQIIYG